MSTVGTIDVSVTQFVVSGLKNGYVEFGMELTRRLSEAFNFDYDLALSMLNLTGIAVSNASKRASSVKAGVEKPAKAVRVVPSIPLPFCGVVNADWCFGVRPTHDLYAQCTNAKVSESEYCRNCNKQAESNSSGKPNYGDINDRLSAGDDYEVNGRKACLYGNVMQRLKISREAAESEASKLGWTIPEHQFELKKSGRGRPKASKPEAGKVAEGGEKKSRGRPSKEKKVVSSGGNDVIAALVAKAKASSKGDESEAAALVDKSVSKTKSSGSKKVSIKVAAAAAAASEEKESDDEGVAGGEAASGSDEYGAGASASNDDDADAKAAAEAEAAAEAAKAAKVAEAKAAKAAESKAAKAAAKAKADADAKAAADAEAAKAAAKAEAKAAAEAEVKAKAAAAAKAASASSKSKSGDLEEESVEESEEEEQVEVEVKAWTHKSTGKKYLKSTLNKVYDLKTQEAIGMWNEKTDEIEPLDESEAESEDEDEHAE